MSKRLLLVGCTSALLAVAGCGGGDNPGTDTGTGGTDGGRDGGGPAVDANVDAFVTPGPDTGVDAFVTPGPDTGVDAFVTPTVDGGTDAFVATVDGGMTTGCELGDTYPSLSFQRLGTVSDVAVSLALAPGRSDIFVVLRSGQIVIMSPTTGAVTATPFLDITSRIMPTPANQDEWGLLGLAFHPDYAANGLAYIAYTTNMGGTGFHDRVAVINRTTTDTASFGSDIFTITDPRSNHNGGQLGFGPDDGYLYYGVGDGGEQNDPSMRAQNTTLALGKIHRFEVGPGIATYNPAPGNPFISGGGLSTIWAYGVRNPWRFSWDRLTHDFYLGDVGQGTWEEIDFLAAPAPAGTNFGWSACEATHDFMGRGCAALTSDVLPIAEYRHTGGGLMGTGGSASVVGGYVYRGAAIPGLRGAYVFADTETSHYAALRNCTGTPITPMPLAGLNGTGLGSDCQFPTTFGEDRNGELLVSCLGDQGIYRIVSP